MTARALDDVEHALHVVIRDAMQGIMINERRADYYVQISKQLERIRPGAGAAYMIAAEAIYEAGGLLCAARCRAGEVA